MANVARSRHRRRRVPRGRSIEYSGSMGYRGELEPGMVLGIKTVEHFGTDGLQVIVTPEYSIRLICRYPEGWVRDQLSDDPQDQWVYEVQRNGPRPAGGEGRYPGQVDVIPELNIRWIYWPLEDQPDA